MTQVLSYLSRLAKLLVANRSAELEKFSVKLEEPA